MLKVRVVPNGSRLENAKSFENFFAEYGKRPKVYANKNTIVANTPILFSYQCAQEITTEPSYSYYNAQGTIDGIEYYCLDKLWVGTCEIDIIEGLLHLVADI